MAPVVPTPDIETPADGSLLAELQTFATRLDALVDGLEPATLHPADAVAVVEQAAAVERRLVGLRLACAPRAAESARVASSGHRSAEHWYASETGVGLDSARRALATGRRLQRLEDTRRSAMTGKLSEAQLDRVADAAAANPGREQTLLRAAGSRTLRGLAEACDQAKAEARRELDEVARITAAHQRRFLRHGRTAEGAFRLEVHTTPDAGARVMAAIERRTAAIFDDARRRGRREPHHAYQVDALVELVTGAPLPAGSPITGGEGEGSPAAPTTALVPAVSSPPTAPPAAPTATITFLVDVEAFRRGHVTAGERCELAGVGPVPVAMVEHYVGSSRLNLVVTRGVDVASVVSLGRAIPRPLRTALEVRDRTCVVPECDVTTPLEIDHWRVPFAQGGPTELANLSHD